MVILRSIAQREMPFQKALDLAKTGDTIIVSQAPRDIENGERFAHMSGVLSLINGIVRLNDTIICSNDVSETHGTFYPFYEKILIHRRQGTMHEFYWMSPSDPTSPSDNTTINPQPAFRFEAEELEIIRLSSGKGLVLIESKPEQLVLLLKMRRFLGTTWNSISAKNVPVAWEGSHTTCIETPSSVVIGAEVLLFDGTRITRFFRGHGRNRVSVHDQPGTLPHIWPTDTEFFYQGNVHGEEVAISAKTGKPFYAGLRGKLYVTSEALVQIEETSVKANEVLVTDSFVSPDWILPHAHGLLYGKNGQIRMLVIKNVPLLS